MGSSRQAKSRKAAADQHVLEKLKTRKITMEQPSDPSAPHQVIYIVQAAKEKVNIKDSYNVKVATVLGIIHIIFGLISLGIEITNLVVDNLSVATGIWTSVFFFISGGLAIGGARSGNKCLVVATLVMAIISAVSAGILLILSTILLVSSYRYSMAFRYSMAPLVFGLLIVTGATMLIIAIASASLTCKPLCCGSSNQGTVHYNPNLVNQVATLNITTLQDPQAHPSTSVQLLPSSSAPPAYQDVAGVGSNYQKF